MSERPVSPEQVTVLKSHYEQLLSQLKTCTMKLRATENIQSLISEKDQEISSLKEANRNYADTLLLSEVRLTKLIALSLSKGQNEEKEHGHSSLDAGKDLPPPRVVTPWSPRTDKVKSAAQLQKEHCLEEDSASFPPEYHFSTSDPNPRVDHDIEVDGDVQDSKSLSIYKSTFSSFFGKDASSPRPHVITSDPSPPNLVPVRHPTSSVPVEPVRPHSAGSISVPSRGTLPADTFSKLSSLVINDNSSSKDLIDKLMQQNARLKRLCKQILNCRGASMNEFLDREENADAIEQLREDLRVKDFKIQELQNIIAHTTNGQEDLTLTYLKKVHTLERTVSIQRALIDGYNVRGKNWVATPHETREKRQTGSQPTSSKLEMLSKDAEELKSKESDDVANAAAACNVAVDASTVAADASTVAAVASTVAADASTVAADASTVAGDASTVAVDASTVAGDASTVAAVASTVAADAHAGTKKLSCDRCDREFEVFEVDKFNDHVNKCEDD